MSLVVVVGRLIAASKNRGYLFKSQVTLIDVRLLVLPFYQDWSRERERAKRIRQKEGGKRVSGEWIMTSWTSHTQPAGRENFNVDVRWGASKVGDWWKDRRRGGIRSTVCCNMKTKICTYYRKSVRILIPDISRRSANVFFNGTVIISRMEILRDRKTPINRQIFPTVHCSFWVAGAGVRCAVTWGWSYAYIRLL